MVDLQIIAPLVRIVRGQRVILDSDLAKLYGVPTKQLNQACNRNPERFPEDFMFLLTRQEVDEVRSQIVTLENKVGRTYLPYAFTEHGAIMAANLLRSKQAIEVSVKVVRTFVEMRKMAVEFDRLEKRIEKLENKYEGHDEDMFHIFETLRQLMLPPVEKKTKIGFITSKK